MNILITGGAGYLGSVLVPRLLDDRHRVTVLDNFRYNNYLSLTTSCWDPRLEIINGDTNHIPVLKPLLQKADVIIPLAAIVGMPACAKHTTEATSTNEYALSYIAAASSVDQLIIYPNTNSGYGRMPEGSNKPMTEDSPLNPLSHYAMTKQNGETAVLHHERSIVFRLATVFGASPRMRTDLLVNSFVLKAMQDKFISIHEPHSRRNYIHIRDVANCFAWFINTYKDQGGMPAWRVFNLGNDEANCTKHGLCEKIKKHIPAFSWAVSAGHDPDQRDYIVSNERLKRCGFKAELSLDDGIVELMKLYKSFPLHQFGNV